MKSRSLFHSLIAFASVALIAAASAFSVAHDTVVAVWRFTVDSAYDFAAKVFAGPVELTAPRERMPIVRLIAAVSYQLRIVKREKPVIFSTWRACPSI